MMEDVLRYYVTALCFVCTFCQGLPAAMKLVLQFLAGPYAVPTGLTMVLLAYWFRAAMMADRAAHQRAVLRSLTAAFFAWGLATLIGVGWQRLLGGVQAVNDWMCWHGLPSACPAAAVGFTLGATVWRWDWRRGLGLCLMTGMWAGAQVCCGVRYPLDVVVGAVLGTALGWWLGSIRWLDRPLGMLVRLARRLMLA